MKKRKSRTKVLILVIIIVIVQVPRLFLFHRYINDDTQHESPLVAIEEMEVTQKLPALETPTPTPEPSSELLTENTPYPTSEPEQELPPADKIINITEDFPELSSELDKLSMRFNCVAVSLVVYDGDIGEYYVYHYGYADRGSQRPVDEFTMFRVASLSKLTTTICAMVLVDRKMLDLDKDISEYLGYEVRNPRYPDKPITSRMLMQHTSSIFDSDMFESSRGGGSSRSTQQLLDSSTSYRQRQPGSGFEYTNFGTSILAAVCEMIFGDSFDIMSREVLFEPLGIDAAYVPTRLDNTDYIAVIYNARNSIGRSIQSQLNVVDSGVLGHDHHLAQGNLTIRVVDYARILAMLGNNGSLHNVRILNPESVYAINNTNVQGLAYAQGLSTRRSVVPFMPSGEAFWHTGSAFGVFAQYIYSADGTNRGVVVVTTGATTSRSSSGMLIVCTEMSEKAWNELKSSIDE